MAAQCAWCGSTDVQALADRYGCLECDRFTLMDGTKADDGLRWTSEKAPATKEPYEQFRAVSKNQSRKPGNVEGTTGGDEMTTTRKTARKKAS